MNHYDYLLIITAFFAGALNSVAGGGSFFTFPALILAGISPIAANATSTIFLWPASITSFFAFRSKLKDAKGYLLKIGILGFIGGIAGAQTLLHTHESTFAYMVPWLLLVATLIFAFGKKIAINVGRLSQKYENFKNIRLVFAFLMFAITSFYGGFFGAGIGILTLSVLYILGMEDIHQMNALKAMLVVVINSAAFFSFIFAPIIAWDKVPMMAVGAMLGSYLGAKGSLRMAPELVRKIVLIVAIFTTVYFFTKQYIIK